MRPRKPASTPRRPTDSEIQQALDKARQILADPDQDWYPANTFKLNAEFELLGLDSYAEQTGALRRAADEVCPDDYEPPEPPGTANEPVCRGTQMLPFVWRSHSFDSMMYFKFGFDKDGHLFVFSLHKPDFPKKTLKTK